MTHDENYKLTTSNYSKAPNPILSHDELLAIIDDNFSQCGDDCESCRRDNASWFALHEVVELCKDKDETLHIGDKALFNSGRNSMRDEIIQAIEKELK